MPETIRIAGHKSVDENALFKLIREVYQSSPFMSEDFDEKFPSFSSFQDFLQKINKTTGAFLQVALSDDQPAAYLVIEPNQASRLKHTAWLNMGVLDVFRGKGIGNMLVDEAFEKIRDEKTIEIVYLMVRADNLPAVKLYQQKGFEIVAKLEKDTKIGSHYFDGILMRKFASNLNTSKIKKS
jgi:ribosomal protein S18 acetylase RimI-like enzyme